MLCHAMQGAGQGGWGGGGVLLSTCQAVGSCGTSMMTARPCSAEHSVSEGPVQPRPSLTPRQPHDADRFVAEPVGGNPDSDVASDLCTRHPAHCRMHKKLTNTAGSSDGMHSIEAVHICNPFKLGLKNYPLFKAIVLVKFNFSPT